MLMRSVFLICKFSINSSESDSMLTCGNFAIDTWERSALFILSQCYGVVPGDLKFRLCHMGIYQLRCRLLWRHAKIRAGRKQTIRR